MPSSSLVISSSSKRIRKPPRPADWNIDHSRVLLRRQGKNHLQTPTGLRRKRQRILARDGESSDEREQDGDPDDEGERIVACPANYSEYRKLSHPAVAASPLPVVITILVTAFTPTQQPSSPVTPPNVHSLAGLPLSILPAPANSGITITPCALSHLHASLNLDCCAANNSADKIVTRCTENPIGY